MNKIIKTAIKYISIALVGTVLFEAASQAANANRPVTSIGGEAFFLALPLFWWLVDETLKDFKSEVKSEQVCKENTRDSPAESEQKE